MNPQTQPTEPKTPQGQNKPGETDVQRKDREGRESAKQTERVGTEHVGANKNK